MTTRLAAFVAAVGVGTLTGSAAVIFNGDIEDGGVTDSFGGGSYAGTAPSGITPNEGSQFYYQTTAAAGGNGGFYSTTLGANLIQAGQYTLSLVAAAPHDTRPFPVSYYIGLAANLGTNDASSLAGADLLLERADPAHASVTSRSTPTPATGGTTWTTWNIQYSVGSDSVLIGLPLGFYFFTDAADDAKGMAFDGTVSVAYEPVPEPGSVSLFAGALALLWATRRRT